MACNLCYINYKSPIIREISNHAVHATKSSLFTVAILSIAKFGKLTDILSVN